MAGLLQYLLFLFSLHTLDHRWSKISLTTLPQKPSSFATSSKMRYAPISSTATEVTSPATAQFFRHSAIRTCRLGTATSRCFKSTWTRSYRVWNGAVSAAQPSAKVHLLTSVLTRQCPHRKISARLLWGVYLELLVMWGKKTLMIIHFHLL